jgi:pimeloyl-ACP methyl ester carboxylesterase
VEKVQSADGTTIAYDRRGEGPALVMVTGAFCDRKSFRSLAACLEPDFAVYLYDRRGRGDSSDAGAYAVEREVEDLAAVVSATGGAAYVFGHSSGAALALEAAAAGVDIRALAAYEPPYTGEGGATPELAEELRRLAASGHREDAATLFLRTTGAPPQVIDMIKAGPDWPGMLAIAHTLSYDITLCNGGVAPVDRLAKIPVPTLALAGGASAGWATEAARSIAATVPDGESQALPGQGHGAADEVLAPVLRNFFTS